MRQLKLLMPLKLASAAAVSVLAMTLAGCGGGNAEAPPQPVGNAVVPAAPVISITNNVTSETATGPITFTFSFNRDVGTSFTVEDVTVAGGTKGAFTRLSGTGATLVVVPDADRAGTLTVSVAANQVSDATGAGNAAVSASKAFNTVVLTSMVNFEESPAPKLTGFGGAEDATVVADPTDARNKVARVVKSASAEVWAGTTVSVCANDAIARIPFSATLTRMSARVWSPIAGIPVRIKVENASNPTQSVETEANVTVASGWQTLNFNFAAQVAGTAALNPALTYNKASVFFNFGTSGSASGARTYFLDDLSFVGSTFTPACPVIPAPSVGTNVTISMDEASAPTFAGFGGAEDASIANDPAGGTNKAARVVKSASAEPWAGTTFSTLAGNQIAPIGFSATARVITARVWSPAAGVPVRLKVENAADPTKSVETEAVVTVANTWQTLSFDFSKQVNGTAALDLAATYNRASIFFNFGTPGAATGVRTYFFEDVVYPAVTPVGGGSASASTTIDFEGAAPTLTGFGGAEDASVIADPTNGANKVVRVIKSASAELWAGTTLSTGAGNTISRIAFAAGKTTITARVWSPAAGIPVRMKVENAADAAVSVETEATVTTASGWQTLNFDFSKQAAGTAALNMAATYNRMSVFFNFGTPGATTGARTYYIDDIVYPSAAPASGGGNATSSTASIDFEGAAPTLTGFGGAEDASVIADPTNGANKVVRVIKSAGAEPWAGTTLSTGAGNTISRIAFATGRTTITARVWSPAAGIPVRMKVENAADAAVSVETEATVTTASGWQTLNFDFSKQAAGTAALNMAATYNRMSVFFNFGTPGATTGARTYYIDDIVYPVSAPAAALRILR